MFIPGFFNGLPDEEIGTEKTRPESAALVVLSLVLFYQVGGGEPERIWNIYLAWKQGVRGNWSDLGA
jgi:hypothetical protein